MIWIASPEEAGTTLIPADGSDAEIWAGIDYTPGDTKWYLRLNDEVHVYATRSAAFAAGEVDEVR